MWYNLVAKRNIVSYGRDSKIDCRRSLAIFTRAEGGKGEGEREREILPRTRTCAASSVFQPVQTARVYPPNDRGDRHAQ